MSSRSVGALYLETWSQNKENILNWMWDFYALNRKQNLKTKKKNFSKSNGVCVNLLNLGCSSKYMMRVLIVAYTAYIEKKYFQVSVITFVYCFKNKIIIKKKKKTRKEKAGMAFPSVPPVILWLTTTFEDEYILLSSVSFLFLNGAATRL